jgi:hypothetical protein
VINALAMAASHGPDPTQFLGIRLPVTFDTCEVIEERWRNWLRHDPVDCGVKDQFNLLYGARRFIRRLNELGGYEPQAGGANCLRTICGKGQRC